MRRDLGSMLEPLRGYFVYAEALAKDPTLPRALNFGPEPGQPVSVAQVADAIGGALGVAQGWQQDGGEHPPEMKLLSLNPALAGRTLGWKPLLTEREGVEWTASWYSEYDRGMDPRALCEAQIREYEALI